MAVDKRKYMDPDEVKTLQTVCEAWSLTDKQKGRVTGVLTWMTVHAALGTGLRANEIAKLRVEAINLKKGTMLVVRSKKRKPAQETLPIGKALQRHLREYLPWRAARIKSLAPQYRKALTATSGALLVGKKGGLGVQGIQRCFKRAAKRAGLPRTLSVHSCRHTLGTLLWRRTGDLRLVQATLGHSSPAVTANMYCHVEPEDIRKGLDDLYAVQG